MKLTNTAKSDRGLGEIVIPAGQTVEVADDCAELATPVVQAWLEDGVLVAECAEDPTDDFDSMNAAALKAWLDERDVEYDGRLGADKLRALARASEA